MTSGASGGFVRAVIFDYKSLFFPGPEDTIVDVRTLLESLSDVGIDICVFSTNVMNLEEECVTRSFPVLQNLVTQKDVQDQKKRGSPNWIDAATAKTGLQRHELLYIGVTNLDWRTAINAGVFYLHAGWRSKIPPGTTSIVAHSPSDVMKFLDHFLVRPPRWSFRLDDPANGFYLRALLPASATLPSTSPRSSFSLQDVFTYDRDIRVGDTSARNLLMLHVLSSCYVEGLLGRNTIFCTYPSSKIGQYSSQIEEYVRPAASLVHGYYRNDLLIRETEAPDTSLVRVRARSEGRIPDVSIATQASTVRLGDKYRGKLGGKRVIVFDDFTTSGMSLEWARNLLLAAGASNVVTLTIGKYKTTHDRHILTSANIDPYAVNMLSPSDYSIQSQVMIQDRAVQDIMHGLFQKWIREVA